MAEVRGIKEIGELMTALPDKMQEYVLRSGNRALAKELSERIASGGGPEIKKAATFGQRINRRERTRRRYNYVVGMRKPWSSLAHLFEFGTSERTQKTTGRSTGRMRALPFMRPPLEKMSEKEAEQIWSKAASRNLDRQLKKVNNL